MFTFKHIRPDHESGQDRAGWLSDAELLGRMMSTDLECMSQAFENKCGVEIYIFGVPMARVLSKGGLYVWFLLRVSPPIEITAANGAHISSIGVEDLPPESYPLTLLDRRHALGLHASSRRLSIADASELDAEIESIILVAQWSDKSYHQVSLGGQVVYDCRCRRMIPLGVKVNPGILMDTPEHRAFKPNMLDSYLDDIDALITRHVCSVRALAMHPTHTVRELAECASLLSTKIACLRHEFEKSSERAQLVRLLRALSYKCRQEVLYERLSAAVMSNMVAEALEVQNDE